MTEQEADDLVFDLVQAVRDLERASSYNYRYYRQEFEIAQNKIVAALMTAFREEVK